MLDRVLGRAELKERIANLEEERDRLAAQLDAEESRRAEAVRQRQEAEERINRLEDRIAELEDRVERSQSDAGIELDLGNIEDLRGQRLEAVLGRLKRFETETEAALSAMITDTLPEPVRNAFGDRAILVRRGAPALVYRDDAGVVSVALSPPLPPEPFTRWESSFRLEEEWFKPTGRIIFGLVRADTFALGVYLDTERTRFEGFTSDVQDQHSKGGFSQSRFERLRDEQIDAHIARCRDVLRDVQQDVEPDQVVLVGADAAVSRLADLATYTDVTDATGDPEDALADAYADFWTTRLHRI